SGTGAAPGPATAPRTHATAALGATARAAATRDADEGDAGLGSATGEGEEERTPAQLADDLGERLRRLLDDAAGVGGLVKRLAERARAEGAGHALSRQQADEAVLGLTRTIGRLRPLPEAIEDLADPS
ncbi:hypothetical protein, partial [Streptomyces albidochromogenes]